MPSIQYHLKICMSSNAIRKAKDRVIRNRREEIMIFLFTNNIPGTPRKLVLKLKQRKKENLIIQQDINWHKK